MHSTRFDRSTITDVLCHKTGGIETGSFISPQFSGRQVAEINFDVTFVGGGNKKPPVHRIENPFELRWRQKRRGPTAQIDAVDNGQSNGTPGLGYFLDQRRYIALR